MVSSAGVLDITISDHLMTFLTLTWKCLKPKPILIRRRSFKNFDESAFHKDLEQAPWSVMDMFDSPGDKLDTFEETFQKCLDYHAPWKMFQVGKNPLSWITNLIRKSIDSRHRLFCHYRRIACPDDWDAYKKQRSHVTHFLYESKKSHYLWLIYNAVSQSSLWKSIKSALPTATPPWEMFHCAAATLANDFNQHFIAVPFATFNSSEDVPPLDCTLQTCVSKQLELKSISKDDYLDLISALHTNKCTDNIPPGILKSVASVVAPPLTNSSLSVGCFLPKWKQACVKSLHKGGDKAKLVNYHPISLLLTCSKMIEQSVRSQLVTHLRYMSQVTWIFLPKSVVCHNKISVNVRKIFHRVSITHSADWLWKRINCGTLSLEYCRFT